MTVIEFYKKYINYIVIALIILLMLKGCQNCSNERQLEYKTIQHEQIIDSMQNIIDERSIDTKDLCDTIHSLRSENTILKEVIRDIKADKEYYKKQNRDLANVAENLSKKDTLK